MDTYFNFNSKGECSLPNKETILAIQEKNENPVIILDSSVCLDIVNYIDKKKLSEKDEKRLINFFSYCNETNIDIVENWGVLELCHNPNHLNIDKEKYKDFVGRINFAIELPFEKLKNKEFDLIDQVLCTDLDKLNKLDGLSVFEPLLFTSYCSLLKIRSIALNGLKKHQAKKNLFDFFDWLDNDLDVMMAVEAQLATNLFGGYDEFKNMIWLDNNPKFIKQKLWGTAWDILHYRIHCNYSELKKINNVQNRVFFVTKDNKLFKLISNLSLLAGIVSQDKVDRTFLHSNDDYPKFKGNYEEIKQTLYDINIKRVLKMNPRKYDKTRILKLIKELEEANNVS